MKAICKSCAISPGTLYHHFISKEALIQAIILQDQERALARFREPIEGIHFPKDGFDPYESKDAVLKRAMDGDGRSICRLGVMYLFGEGGMEVDIEKAIEEDFGTEYLDYIISIKTVKSLDEAIEHINQYNTGHSETIITENQEHADRFLHEIDAACVYVNASTRFTDGFEFGFGAEIGISTQKLHARGPMGLKELTSYKYEIIGNGQIRG